jgi:hypothetical protein
MTYSPISAYEIFEVKRASEARVHGDGIRGHKLQQLEREPGLNFDGS